LPRLSRKIPSSKELIITKLFTKRNFKALALLTVLGLAAFWVLTIPHPLTADQIPKHVGDVANGEKLFNAGGCHSCHLPAKDSGLDEASVAGGTPLKTPIGILYPPNLTPDPETGLGNWTDADFVNAMQKGIGKNGEHLIPAFPYTSYTYMRVEDVLDIKAYLATLQPVKNAAKPHEILAEPIIRRGLGLWKYVGLNDTKHKGNIDQSAYWNLGAYLVKGPGHCGECHTPRTFYMASDDAKFLNGGPHPDGQGNVPSLRDLVGRGKYKDAADLVLAFQNGEAFGYEHMASGGMGAVQRNLAKLPEEDLNAIAEYLLSLK
jgi:mono/diheme cytochrome c family protein